jgi:hypothetical protein
MEWRRLYSLCRPNNSRLDNIAQGELTLTVRLLNDGQGPVAEIARKRGIPRNRSYKPQKEVPLHGGVFPGSGWANRTGCRTGPPQVRSTRRKERLVGRSAAAAVVGVAEEVRALVDRLISWRWRAWPQPAKLSAGF